MERLPGGNLPRQGRTPGQGQAEPPQRGVGARGRGKGAERGQGVGLGTQAMPGPGGGQLARRVESGAITGDQAQKTMQQRQTLQKAFGPDWRTKVFGDRGYMQRTRTALAKNPKNPRLAALNKKLMERRQQMLEAARKKNSGEGEGEE